MPPRAWFYFLESRRSDSEKSGTDILKQITHVQWQNRVILMRHEASHDTCLNRGQSRDDRGTQKVLSPYWPSLLYLLLCLDFPGFYCSSRSLLKVKCGGEKSQSLKKVRTLINSRNIHLGAQLWRM